MPAGGGSAPAVEDASAQALAATRRRTRGIDQRLTGGGEGRIAADATAVAIVHHMGVLLDRDEAGVLAGVGGDEDVFVSLTPGEVGAVDGFGFGRVEARGSVGTAHDS